MQILREETMFWKSSYKKKLFLSLATEVKNLIDYYDMTI